MARKDPPRLPGLRCASNTHTPLTEPCSGERVLGVASSTLKNEPIRFCDPQKLTFLVLLIPKVFGERHPSVRQLIWMSSVADSAPQSGFRVPLNPRDSHTFGVRTDNRAENPAPAATDAALGENIDYLQPEYQFNLKSAKGPTSHLLHEGHEAD